MTDKEILEDYCRICEMPYPVGPFEEYFLRMILQCRIEEPRINCGAHFYDYIEIVDDDDDMDSYYGEDYFKD